MRHDARRWPRMRARWPHDDVRWSAMGCQGVPYMLPFVKLAEAATPDAALRRRDLRGLPLELARLAYLRPGRLARPATRDGNAPGCAGAGDGEPRPHLGPFGQLGHAAIGAEGKGLRTLGRTPAARPVAGCGSRARPGAECARDRRCRGHPVVD